MIRAVPRVVVIVPTATYRAPDFVAAARSLGVELVVASDEPPVLAEGVRLPLDDPDAAADAIVELDRRLGVDAVVAVDDGGVVVAATAGARLGFPHNPPDAAAATRDKAELRRRLAAGEVPQPGFGVESPGVPPDAPSPVGYPCVVKPTGLSGSRGVLRADDPTALAAARSRIRRFWPGELLVEEYLPGDEVAVEGLLRGGELEVLAIFDKPDPLTGPTFPETIYVTPSRLPAPVRSEVTRVVGAACAAMGLQEGPIHAEARVAGTQVRVLEVAARTIGGLCARTLRFGTGVSLEEVVLRHALGLPLDDLHLRAGASGVMMLPVPRTGTLERVAGIEAARTVPGVEGVELTVPVGATVDALPEGDRYLGFIFARAPSPEGVEAALRRAASSLDIVIR